MNKTEKENVKTELLKQLLKVKWIAVGECPQCGKEIIRNGECDMAVCVCQSVVKVDLTLAAILPPKLESYFEDLAKQVGCSVDDIFNKCFEVGLQNLEKRLEVKH